jgi:hypothetical protein
MTVFRLRVLVWLYLVLWLCMTQLGLRVMMYVVVLIFARSCAITLQQVLGENASGIYVVSTARRHIDRHRGQIMCRAVSLLLAEIVSDSFSIRLTLMVPLHQLKPRNSWRRGVVAL